MTQNTQGRVWDVRRALHLMHGMEHATRLLLADFERELVDRDSYKTTSPRAIGVATVTTVQCALFCEYAIKTFHASIAGGSYRTGHKLLDLYSHLETQYRAVEEADEGHLSALVISQMRSSQACCPQEWTAGISDIRAILRQGSDNFEVWRYGYPESGQLGGGVPKALFCIGKGLELLSRRRFLGTM